MKQPKFGCEYGTSAVYLLTCKVNGKKYVGSSKNAAQRISTHLSNGNDERYPNLELYSDIAKYGRENFDHKILETCSEEDLIKREQFYYDQIQPEYNEFRPVENLFDDPGFRQYLIERNKANTEKNKRQSELFNTPEYKRKFQLASRSIMRPVDMFDLDGDYIRSFVSIREASRWIKENTNYKGSSSSIKAVCARDRKTAYGYIFQYSKKSVETILKESRLVIDTQVEAVELSDDDNVK